MIVTKKQLQQIIKEEVERQHLQQLDEGMMEKVLEKAGQVLTKLGPKAAEWISSFLESNPEIGAKVAEAIGQMKEIMQSMDEPEGLASDWMEKKDDSD
jgi:hypothetical protein